MDLIVSAFASLLTLVAAKMLIVHGLMSQHATYMWILGSVLFSCLFLVLFRTHRSIIRHTSLRTLAMLCLAVFFKDCALGVLMAVMLPNVTGGVFAIVVFDFLLTFVSLVMVRIIMIFMFNFVREYRGYSNKPTERLHVLIYGTKDRSVSMLTSLMHSYTYQVCGFLTDVQDAGNKTIAGKRVFTFGQGPDVTLARDEAGAQAVLFVSESDLRSEDERLVKYAITNGMKVLFAPSIDEVKHGRLKSQPIREVKIEDLLGRDEIKINETEIEKNFRGKVVLVTGAAGSIGSELCRQLAMLGVRQLVLFDNNETPMHNLRLELEDSYPELDFVPIIGDVRLLSRLDYVFRTWRPQVVFHAAAYKHVPLMEENPCEAVLVNVAGSKNVADKCIEYDVEKMVMVSTDKAVNPTNIMGCTKRLAEIYVQSLGLAIEQGRHVGRTKFVTTRFGNVLGSNGSVIPRFREQIAKGGPITVTHPEITRFFMTIPEACRLVMEAATMSTGNQIFVFDMGKSVKIATLAERMIHLAGLKPGRDIEIVYTGLRPGEKLYEEVLSNAENTLPTNHDRIRIAQVREYAYADANQVAEDLERLSREVNIPDMVRLMKRVVPEFKSKNSRFEQYDNTDQLA